MQKRLMQIFLIGIFCFLVIDLSAQGVKSVKITEVEKLITESKTPLIVNMWATWCIPCIQEIPYFIDEVRKNNSGLNPDSITLVLVSLDFKEAFPKDINSFVKKRKFIARVLWLDETNADYFCPKVDEKWSGAIPATLFINNKTGYRKFVEEQVSHDDLKLEISQLVQKK